MARALSIFIFLLFNYEPRSRGTADEPSASIRLSSRRFRGANGACIQADSPLGNSSASEINSRACFLFSCFFFFNARVSASATREHPPVGSLFRGATCFFFSETSESRENLFVHIHRWKRLATQCRARYLARDFVLHEISRNVMSFVRRFRIIRIHWRSKILQSQRIRTLFVSNISVLIVKFL